jgi:uncharacterized protein DUF3987
MAEVNATKAKNRLTEHLAGKPKKPRKTQFIQDDVTYQALLEGMHENCKNVCVLADEGTGTLNRFVTPGMSMLNSAWSNMEITIGRKTSESFNLPDPRITFLLSIQPGPFEEYRERKSDMAKAAGLWSRTITCSAQSSTIGYRLALENKQDFFDPSQYLVRFQKLLKKNLKLGKNPKNRRSILKFDKRARSLYVEIINEIEENMRPGGLYEHASDHASKLMENIARLSAIIHVVNGYEGDISWETLNISIQICIFFSKEYLNIFNTQPQFFLDAMMLNDWLTLHIRQKGLRYIEKRYARQYCSGPLRQQGRFREALDYLECHGYIRTYQDITKTWHIDTFPTYP